MLIMLDIMRSMSEVREMSRMGDRERKLAKIEKKDHRDDIIDNCRHGSVIHDHVSGHEVCSSCGLVLDVIMKHEKLMDDSVYHRTEDEACKELPQVREVTRDTRFSHICDQNMLNEGIANRASIEFARFSKMKAGRHFTTNQLEAYSLYYATFAEKSPRPPVEIAAYTNVTKKVLCDMERVFPIPLDSLKPKLFLPRFCYFLGYSGKDQVAMESMCQKLTRVDAYDPRTVAGTVIYLYYIMESAIKPTKKLTQKKIGDICNVSSTSISKCLPLVRLDIGHS